MSTVGQVLRTKNSIQVWTVRGDETVFEAVRRMADKNIGALLVTDGVHLQGIFTERDYARKIILDGKSSKTTLVTEVMSREVNVVDPGDAVERCMAVMLERKVRHLPVIEHGRVCGLISMGDVMNALLSDREFLIEELTRYITGRPSIAETEVVIGHESLVERRTEISGAR